MKHPAAPYILLILSANERFDDTVDCTCEYHGGDDPACYYRLTPEERTAKRVEFILGVLNGTTTA